MELFASSWQLVLIGILKERRGEGQKTRNVK
jgi:hypothetical protein